MYILKTSYFKISLCWIMNENFDNIKRKKKKDNYRRGCLSFVVGSIKLGYHLSHPTTNPIIFYWSSLVHSCLYHFSCKPTLHLCHTHKHIHSLLSLSYHSEWINKCTTKCAWSHTPHTNVCWSFMHRYCVTSVFHKRGVNLSTQTIQDKL